MKVNTDTELKDLLSRIAAMLIEFEDDNDVIIGSSIHIRSLKYFEDFNFNGEKFVRVDHEKDQT